MEREDALGEALKNLTRAQRYEVLTYEVIGKRGHLRIRRFGVSHPFVDWWPYHRKAKLHVGHRIKKHRATCVDHILDILDFGEVQ